MMENIGFLTMADTGMWKITSNEDIPELDIVSTYRENGSGMFIWFFSSIPYLPEKYLISESCGSFDLVKKTHMERKRRNTSR